MNIDFWSDIVCPYCGLMDHRLRTAIDRSAFATHVTVRHRSFQLHPEPPRDGVDQRDLFVEAGLPRADAERVLRPIEQAARAEGLVPYRALDRTLGPTDFAHELLAYATDHGRGDDAWHAMFRAHFGQARKLWTLEDVLAFAGEIGLDPQDASAALHERRYRSRVEADQREAIRLGAHGTPFLLLDGRYTIQGAVDTDALLSAITRVFEETHSAPSALPSLGEPGQSCTRDGCL